MLGLCSQGQLLGVKAMELLWLIIGRLVGGALGGLLVVAALALLILLGGCQARVGEAAIKDAEVSLLCGSSSNRLLPECQGLDSPRE